MAPTTASERARDVATAIRSQASVRRDDVPVVGGKGADPGEPLSAATGDGAVGLEDPDAVDSVRATVVAAEQRLLLEAARAGGAAS